MGSTGRPDLQTGFRDHGGRPGLRDGVAGLPGAAIGGNTEDAKGRPGVSRLRSLAELAPPAESPMETLRASNVSPCLRASASVNGAALSCRGTRGVLATKAECGAVSRVDNPGCKQIGHPRLAANRPLISASVARLAGGLKG